MSGTSRSNRADDAVAEAPRGRPPRRRGAPHGEDAVRSSLLAAATELFADQGPGQVSVRQVADAAGVNHGLVHYYFGSKDGLLAAVLDQCARDVADELADNADLTALLDSSGAVARHGRLLAHLILAADDPAAFQTDFPTQRLLVEHLRARGLSLPRARRRAAQMSALVLGWQLFGPFLTTATGIAHDDRHRQALLDEAIDRLLA